MKNVKKRPPAYEQILANRGISLPISAKNVKMIHQAFGQRIKMPIRIGDVASILLLEIAINAELNRVDVS